MLMQRENIQVLLETAYQALAASRHREAALICRKLLAQRSDDVETITLLASIEHLQGNAAQSASLFAAALEYESLNAAIWSNLGVVLLSQGKGKQAQACLEQALTINPEFGDAWNNLGTLYEGFDLKKAETCYRRARELQPHSAGVCNNLALCYKKGNRPAEAVEWYRASLALQPEQAAVWYRLAEVLEQLSDVDGAQAAYRRSYELAPDDALLVKMATVLPVILPAVAIIEPIRLALLHELQQLLQQQLRIERPWERGRVFFYLAYHDRNDCVHSKLLAAIYRAGCPQLSWQAPHLERKRMPGRRIRVGFISRFFFSHTIAKLNIGTVERLDRSKFHITVLLIDAGIRDAMTARFEAAADAFIVLPHDFYAMRELVAAQELDLLLYTDIGMEPFSYFLAFARLARVQCVTWGHPTTTGIDTVDYFISHEDCETEQSRTAYTEQLFCLSSAVACCCYAHPDLLPAHKQRQDFGLDPDRTVYYCPQPLFKLHPDFDVMLARILEADPNGCLVLLRGISTETETLLRKRFGQLLPYAAERIIFLDPLPFAEYLTMMMLADVVLDTPGFSGGSSTVEALACGAAVVTLPSRYLKGRLTLAWYRRIGVTECVVASSAEEYVRLAVSLGTDRLLRDQTRRKIREACHLLFDDAGAVRELEAFFEQSLADNQLRIGEIDESYQVIC